MLIKYFFVVSCTICNLFTSAKPKRGQKITQYCVPSNICFDNFYQVVLYYASVVLGVVWPYAKIVFIFVLLIVPVAFFYGWSVSEWIKDFLIRIKEVLTGHSTKMKFEVTVDENVLLVEKLRATGESMIILQTELLKYMDNQWAKNIIVNAKTKITASFDSINEKVKELNMDWRNFSEFEQEVKFIAIVTEQLHYAKALSALPEIQELITLVLHSVQQKFLSLQDSIMQKIPVECIDEIPIEGDHAKINLITVETKQSIIKALNLLDVSHIRCVQTPEVLVRQSFNAFLISYENCISTQLNLCWETLQALGIEEMNRFESLVQLAIFRIQEIIGLSGDDCFSSLLKEWVTSSYNNVIVYQADLKDTLEVEVFASNYNNVFLYTLKSFYLQSFQMIFPRQQFTKLYQKYFNWLIPRLKMQMEKDFGDSSHNLNLQSLRKLKYFGPEGILMIDFFNACFLDPKRKEIEEHLPLLETMNAVQLLYLAEILSVYESLRNIYVEFLVGIHLNFPFEEIVSLLKFNLGNVSLLLEYHRFFEIASREDSLHQFESYLQVSLAELGEILSGLVANKCNEIKLSYERLEDVRTFPAPVFPFSIEFERIEESKVLSERTREIYRSHYQSISNTIIAVVKLQLTYIERNLLIDFMGNEKLFNQVCEMLTIWPPHLVEKLYLDTERVKAKLEEITSNLRRDFTHELGLQNARNVINYLIVARDMNHTNLKHFKLEVYRLELSALAVVRDAIGKEDQEQQLLQSLNTLSSYAEANKEHEVLFRDEIPFTDETSSLLIQHINELLKNDNDNPILDSFRVDPNIISFKRFEGYRKAFYWLQKYKANSYFFNRIYSDAENCRLAVDSAIEDISCTYSNLKETFEETVNALDPQQAVPLLSQLQNLEVLFTSSFRSFCENLWNTQTARSFLSEKIQSWVNEACGGFTTGLDEMNNNATRLESFERYLLYLNATENSRVFASYGIDFPHIALQTLEERVDRTIDDMFQEGKLFIRTCHNDMEQSQRFIMIYDTFDVLKTLLATPSRLKTTVTDHLKVFDEIAWDLYQDAVRTIKATLKAAIDKRTVNPQEDLEADLLQLAGEFVRLFYLRKCHVKYQTLLTPRFEELLQYVPLSSRIVSELGTILSKSLDGFEIMKEASSTFEEAFNAMFATDATNLPFHDALQNLKGNPLIDKARLQDAYTIWKEKHDDLVNGFFDSTLKIQKVDLVIYMKNTIFGLNDESTFPVRMNEGIYPIIDKWRTTINHSAERVVWDRSTQRLALSLLPYVTAVKTINSPNCSWVPLPIQIMAILRIFRKGKSKNLMVRMYNNWVEYPRLESQILDVGTGNGKTPIIAIASVIFAFLGYNVRIACYSDELVDRDEAEFAPFYSLFRLQKDQIVYGSIYDLVEGYLDQKGDIRERVISMLLNKQDTVRVSTNLSPTVLFLDEVDTLLQPQFYRETYNANAELKHETISAMVSWMWRERRNLSTIEDVKSSQEYKRCIEYFRLWPNIIDNAVEEMFRSLRKVLEDKLTKSLYFDNDTLEIGYIINDAPNFLYVIEYEKMFGYFREYEKRGISFEGEIMEKQVFININVGRFLYCKLIQQFVGIFGLTGTYDKLYPSQKKALRTLLSTDENNNELCESIIPPAYGSRIGRFHFSESSVEDVQIIEDEHEFFSKINAEIFKRIKDTRNANNLKLRPVIVYFQNKEILNKFECFYKPKLPGGCKLQRLLEEDRKEERRDRILRAVHPGMITLTVPIFGRGINYFYVDEELNARGGVHILQTYFAEDISEEIQIQGRTSRKNNTGSYSLILLQNDLAKLFKLDLSEISEYLHPPKDAYKKLNELREQKCNQTMSVMANVSDSMDRIHNESISLMDHFDKLALQLFYKIGLELKNTSLQPKNIIFAIDYSGSMAGKKIEITRKNLSQILEEKLYNNDSVAMLRFNNAVLDMDCELKMKNDQIEELRAFINRLRDPTGGTAIYDTLDHCFELFRRYHATRKDQAVDNDWIVLLTDGDDGTNGGVHTTLEKICSRVSKQSDISVIVIGVGGAEFNKEKMEKITSSSLHGRLIEAGEDGKSIDDAFQKVMDTIENVGSFNRKKRESRIYRE